MRICNLWKRFSTPLAAREKSNGFFTGFGYGFNQRHPQIQPAYQAMYQSLSALHDATPDEKKPEVYTALMADAMKATESLLHILNENRDSAAFSFNDATRLALIRDHVEAVRSEILGGDYASMSARWEVAREMSAVKTGYYAFAELLAGP